MKKVILYTQNHSTVAPVSQMPEKDEREKVYDAISYSVARLAEKIDADVIVCQTATGATATTMAAKRPDAPILSVTPNPRVANQLSLFYANTSFMRPYSPEFGYAIAKEFKDTGYLKTKPGNKDLLAVIVSGDKYNIGTDTIRVRYI